MILPKYFNQNPQMPFRIQARHLFLTYPQCYLNHEEIYNHLLNLNVGNESPEKICVSKELHEDGSPHFHVYLCYPSRRDLRHQRHFDINSYHPNIQSCKSPKAVLKYVTKDGEYMANFDIIKPTVKSLLERADDENSFIDLCLEKFDSKFAASFSNYMALYRAKRPHTKVSDQIGDWTSFKIYDIFLYARLLSIELHEKNGTRTRSLWLWGPSRTGKTSLARSIGKHIYMNNTWCADLISDEAQYLILDDISWDSLRWQYKSILGCQRDVTFTGKYFRPKTFHFNIPCIVITNEKPVLNQDELDWFAVNVDFVHIENKLY